MFRSKGFTAAFCLLSVLIIGLSVILGILLFSDSGDRIFTGQEIIDQQTAGMTPQADAGTSELVSDSEPSTEATAETEATTAAPDNTLRALTEADEHSLPVIGEEIPEKGVLTIIRSGDNGEGLCFHKLPRFDAMTASGNLVNFSGSFDIVSKVYVTDNGRPCLMYKTDDGYYVTGSDFYVTYEPAGEPMTEKDVTKVVSYGYDENQGVVITVYHDDGNTLSMSMFDYSGSATSVRLANIIAVYDEEGAAHFEYHNEDGQNYKGRVSFDDPDDGYVMKQITVEFESPVTFAIGSFSSVTLHN